MGTLDAPKPLAGYTIGVTADRRSDEQISLLTGRGAECLHGPTVRTHPLRPEKEIAEATGRLLAEPPEFVLLTTGIGVRGWLESADALLIGEQLRAVLTASRLLVRGPKAHGAAITAGLEVEWNAPSATSAELIAKLDELADAGSRIGVQVDGDPHRSLVPELRDRGYDVVPVPVYRWSLPDDLTRANSLIRAVVDRRVDLVTFTARPAAENFTRIAADLGALGEVRAAFAERVKIVCIGHVCAEGVVDLCEAPIIPARFRLGAMVMTITDELAADNQTIAIGGHEIHLQGRMAWVAGGEPVTLTGRERQILQVLMARNGAVVPKEDLLRTVWRGTESDPHVVEVTVGRLRRRLGPAGPGIETVIRRGYRLSPT
ncbi:MAG: uroporphyrinogen-III synthase [Actinomycetota bacterium]